MSREYILSVPSNYNPNTPYRLIFGWHPWGGSAMQVAGTGNSGYYGLKGTSNNQAILVSPEGPTSTAKASVGGTRTARTSRS